jgi:eukaryotic-like serine/threonine-protein kinase
LYLEHDRTDHRTLSGSRTGQAKILDFGVAKLAAEWRVARDSTTLTQAVMTVPGEALGTVA